MDKSHQGGLRILFADDEAHLRDLMQMELPRLGHEVTVCPDGSAALKALEKGSYDVALLDLRMPGLTGIEVLGKVTQISPETQVIILTGHATVDTAVQALRLGAFDYLTKPCKWAELEVLLARVAERRDLSNKATALETRLKAAEGSPTLIGETPAMLSVRRLIDTIAPTDASVMILGETGTGKELIARSLHDKSQRAGHAFIPVNCGALPENLVESELFGHRKGAFTGADAHRKGLFEVANGGTLFLDEVGELEQERAGQAAALPGVGRDPPGRRERPVPRRCPRPLRHQSRPPRDDRGRSRSAKTSSSGSTRSRSTSRRSASAKPTSPRWPRTCSRVTRTARRRSTPTLTPEAHRRADANTTGLATSASWPTRSSGPRFSRRRPDPSRAPAHAGPLRRAASGSTSASPAASAVSGPHFQVPDGSPTLRDIEMKYIQVILEKHNGNKPAASKELGISLKTLYNKINQLQQS